MERAKYGEPKENILPFGWGVVAAIGQHVMAFMGIEVGLPN